MFPRSRAGRARGRGARASAYTTQVSNIIRVTIPGASARKRQGGTRLIRDFLWATAGLSDEESARIAGVSIATLNRWRRSGSQRLRGDIRERIAAYLALDEEERKRLAA